MIESNTDHKVRGESWVFSHAGIIVRDVDATCSFYATLGFEILDPPFETSPRTEDNPRTSRIARMTNGSVVLEFIQPLDGRWINKEFLETVGEGINHLAFEVADLEAEIARMSGLGFEIVLRSPRAVYFDTRRVGNVIIELVKH